MSVTPSRMASALPRYLGAQRVSTLALPALLVVLVVAFSIDLPNLFVSTANWRSTTQSMSEDLVIAMALIIPLSTGRFDLSVGANIGISSVLIGQLMADDGVSLIPALAAGVAAGIAIGTINGVIVAYVNVDSIIATLGTSTLLGGILTLQSNGQLITNGLSSTLVNFGIRNTVGIPDTFIAALVIAAIVWFVTTQTVFGRHLNAIGSNEQSATLVGINVRRSVFWSFVASGALGAVAGALSIANTGSADPNGVGLDTLLVPLAGLFLGVTAFSPGKYNVPGTIVGLAFLSVAVSGLALIGVPAWVAPTFNGTAIVVAVSVAAILGRRGHA